METVKVLRLKSGEDVIAYMYQVDSTSYVLKEPMVVVAKYNFTSNKHAIMMTYWLPAPLLKSNEAFITNSDIITIMEPSSDFLEYYENTVNSLVSARNQDDSEEAPLSEEEMNLMLDSMEKESNKLVH